MPDTLRAIDRPRHRHPVRVYWEDTDAGGVVYHASYLRFAERARTELLRSIGTDQSDMLADHGTLFVVRRAEVDYLKPAGLDDSLTVESRLTDLRNASMCILHEIRRGDELLTRLVVQVACIDRSGRVARIPLPVRRALAAGHPPPATTPATTAADHANDDNV